MRIFGFILIVALFGCVPTDASLEADGIEVQSSSPWESFAVQINRSGDGDYWFKGYAPPIQSGKLKITREQFRAFSKRIEPFERVAEARVGHGPETAVKCPDGVPGGIDLATISIVWKVRGAAKVYIGGPGCMTPQSIGRDAEVYEAIKSLPVPASFR